MVTPPINSKIINILLAIIVLWLSLLIFNYYEDNKDEVNQQILSMNLGFSSIRGGLVDDGSLTIKKRNRYNGWLNGSFVFNFENYQI